MLMKFITHEALVVVGAVLLAAAFAVGWLGVILAMEKPS